MLQKTVQRPIRTGIGIMRVLGSLIAGALYALSALPASAQGTLPIALTQQFSFISCSTTSIICGNPLISGLLYFYQVGTVSSPQDSFQDTGLSLKNPWPLKLDANGRVPMFYLANGSVHVRLTDANGVVQFDYPSMLVIGPSSGGGGGSSVDPTTIAATGDVKFRPTSEILTGWVKLNGQTIGSATSGATQRANADTQNLYTYLWTNCPNSHCPVSGGRGASALADFSANKAIGLPDWRDVVPTGLDDMGTTAKGGILSSNVTSGGGDGPTTPGASGGEANHTLLAAQLPASGYSFAGTQQTWTSNQNNIDLGIQATLAPGGAGAQLTSTGSITVTVTPAGTVTVPGGGNAHNVMQPFILGTWYEKL